MNRFHPQDRSQSPDDAYERVTNPERFGSLHAFADRLVQELTERHEVEVAVGDPDSLRPGGLVELARVVELVSHDPDAATLTVGYTDFPGVVVRFGPWHVEAFPSCGCDACDEQPDELECELQRLVGAVTSGGFTESISGRWLTTEFVAETGDTRRSERKLSREQKRRRGGSGRRTFSPWPTRHDETRTG